jgi:hypothetical protein
MLFHTIIFFLQKFGKSLCLVYIICYLVLGDYLQNFGRFVHKLTVPSIATIIMRLIRVFCLNQIPNKIELIIKDLK